MSDTKYIKIRTKNAKMLMMYGDKLTASEWLRKARTNGLHVEVQFSDRYGSISFSSTLSDGCNGCRFKMIGYSHSYRWSTIYIAVTADQEVRLFVKACEMADIVSDSTYRTDDTEGWYYVNKDDEGCIYGPDHIKYDKGAAFFSFISKRNIWKPSKTKMICNRACAVLMLEVWPDLLDAHAWNPYDISGENTKGLPMAVVNRLDPATLKPDQFHYQAAYYFENIKPL